MAPIAVAVVVLAAAVMIILVLVVVMLVVIVVLAATMNTGLRLVHGQRQTLMKRYAISWSMVGLSAPTEEPQIGQ